MRRDKVDQKPRIFRYKCWVITLSLNGPDECCVRSVWRFPNVCVAEYGALCMSFCLYVFHVQSLASGQKGDRRGGPVMKS